LNIKFNGVRQTFKHGKYRKLKNQTIYSAEGIYEEDTCRLKIGSGLKNNVAIEEKSYLNEKYVTSDWFGDIETINYEWTSR
jgi:hypothetical protein